MNKHEATKYLTTLYVEACDRFPRTREISLELYLQRNVPHLLRWRNSREYRLLIERRR
jgi:hypothetical protein